MEADFSVPASMMSAGGRKSGKVSPPATPRGTRGNNNGPNVLLRRVAPVHRGALRRRTRFTRGWRNEGDVFEIRGQMLVLYKSRKTGSISFLDSIFSKVADSSSDQGDSQNSGGGSGGGAGGTNNAAVSAGEWDATFDLNGAVVASVPASEKDRTYPFKVTFRPGVHGGAAVDGSGHGNNGSGGSGGSGGGGGNAANAGSMTDRDARTLHLCADSEASRAKWVQYLETASKGVSRQDFELLRTVGRGQWGTVYLARKVGQAAAASGAASAEAADGGLVALKEVQLSPNTNINHVQNERLIMEAVPPHEFVVDMQFAFRAGRYLYYALDFMSGGDLFRHWRRHRDRRNEMAPFYVAEVLLALQHLHAHRVIYRDLKPENVLLDSKGHVKVADLGLAKVLHAENGRTTSFCGTEAYLAPEMILRLPYDYSVDFWQFGCFLFELYAGRSPFWLPRKPRKFIRENILNGTFTFPTVVPESARCLVSGLLQVNDAQRLGSTSSGGGGWAEVRSDPFFANTDWDAMITKRLAPPVVPEDPGPDQVGNFDEDFTNLEVSYAAAEDPAAPAAGAAYEDELLGFGFVRRAALA